jgi:hypothetical protein
MSQYVSQLKRELKHVMIYGFSKGFLWGSSITGYVILVTCVSFLSAFIFLPLNIALVRLFSVILINKFSKT